MLPTRTPTPIQTVSVHHHTHLSPEGPICSCSVSPTACLKKASNEARAWAVAPVAPTLHTKENTNRASMWCTTVPAPSCWAAAGSCRAGRARHTANSVRVYRKRARGGLGQDTQGHVLCREGQAHGRILLGLTERARGGSGRNTQGRVLCREGQAWRGYCIEINNYTKQELQRLLHSALTRCHMTHCGLAKTI